MKKFTLLILFLLSIISVSFGQVQVGTGNNETTNAPFEPFYSYSYNQSIYLASEINATGTITSIQWYFSGTSLLPDSQEIVIYMANTTKTAFTGIDLPTADFVPLASLTQVYSGPIPVGAAPGWITITLTTPFVYNGTSNLLVAVDENLPNYDELGDDFWNSPVATKRSASVFLDGENVNPATPTVFGSGSPQFTNVAFVPNIIFGGITQACPNLTATPVASSVTTSTATVTWTAPVIAPAGGYQYYVSTSAITPAVSATPTGVTAAGVLTANLNALLPATTYYVSLRGACSATSTSGWSAPAVFITACVPTTSFSQNFDAGITLPVCWTKVGITGQGTINVGNASSASNSLLMTGGAITQPTTVAMPAISNAGAGTHRLRFKTIGFFSTTGVIEVGYITDLTNPATFVSVQSIATPSSTVYQDNVVIMGTSPGAAQYLAFRHSGTAGATGSVLIDDVAWETIPLCINPTLPLATGITTTTVDLSWTEPTVPALSYDYYVSTSSTLPIATTTPTGNVVGLNNTQITGLLAGTKYYVWVRSRCTATNLSAWSSSVIFTTECNPTALPWFENFDTLAVGNNIFPNCWNYFNTLKDWNIETTPVANSGTKSLGRTWGTNGWAFSPIVTLTAGTSYTFSYFVRTDNAIVGYDITVGVGNTQTVAGMATTLSTVTGYNVAAWTKKTHTFIPTTSGNYSFGLKVAALNPPDGINFDDISIKITPDCLEPTLVNATAITTTAATITWTEPVTPAANGYEYFVSTANLAPTTSATGTTSVVAGLNNVNLTGLTNNTNYYVWVRSVCSVTNKSEWSQSAVFKTLCLPQALPWIENFDTLVVGTNLFPDCWNYENTVSSWNITNTATGSNSGTKSLARPFGTTNGWAFSPLVTLTAGTSYTFSYFVKTANTNVGYDITIGVGNTQSSVSMSTTLSTDTGYNVNVWTKKSHTYVPTVSGIYSFGMKVVSTTFATSGINFDDVAINVTPNCLEPTALQAIVTSSSTVNLSWTAPTTAVANGYQYYVSTTNVAPITTTTPTGSVASGTTVSVSGLAPSTLHYFWVRSVCSSTESSAWSVVKSFITAVAPNCATLVAPANGSTTIGVGSIVLSWTAPTTGGTVVSYDIFTGPSVASATTLLTNTTSTSTTMTVNTYNTTIYWVAVPKNAGGLALGCTKFSFTTVPPTGYCLAGVLFPTETFVPTICNSVTVSTITTGAYAGEYSNVTVTAGQNYKFASSVATDLITISANNGATAVAYGNGSVIWTAATAGTVRFYIHLDTNCTTQNTNRIRTLVCGAALSTTNFDNNAFSYYPNPVKDVLNVSYNSTISKVSIYNLLGQEVLTKAINENLGQVDMSNLSAGTYLVKVVADGNTKTIKVIKE